MSAYNILCRFPLITIILLSMVACATDTDATPGRTDEGSSDVTFSINVPTSDAPASRAMDKSEEDAVRTVDVLVFVDGKFAEHAEGKDVRPTVVTGKNTTYQFTAKLKKQVLADLVFIANAHTAVEAYVNTNGLSEFTIEQLRQGLILDNTDANYFSALKWIAAAPASDPQSIPAPIPMWGMARQQIIDVSRQIDINLLRMLARIDIVIPDGVDFALQEVLLYNPMKKGYVIPDPSYLSVEQKALAPTYDRSFGWETTVLSYNPGTPDNGLSNEIYLFEAPAWADNITLSENTFIVIKGIHETGAAPTYYRLDIAGKEDNEDKWNYLPILRNHYYRFTINGINKPGGKDAEEAIFFGPQNHTVGVPDRDGTEEYHYFIYDGKYRLSIEQPKFVLSADGQTDKFWIKTDWAQGWTAVVSDKPDEEGAGHPAGWLKLKSPNGPAASSELEYTVEQNPGLPRTAFIHFTSGPLKGVVEVRQTDEPGHDIKITLSVNSWEDDFKQDVDAKGPYRLDFDEVDIKLKPAEGTKVINYFSDYPLARKVTISPYIDQPDFGQPDWIKTLSYDSNRITVDYSANTGAERYAYIHVTAGRMTVVLKITQAGVGT